MEEVDDDFDPNNDTSYGKSSNGHEVMIVNDTAKKFVRLGLKMTAVLRLL